MDKNIKTEALQVNEDSLIVVMFGYNHEALSELAHGETAVSVIVAEEPGLYEKKNLAERSRDPHVASILKEWVWCEYQNSPESGVPVVQRLLTQFKIAGILPGLEYAVPAANAAAQACGLPNVGRYAALTDKIEFRKKTDGILWREVSSVNELLPPPCVLKPANRQASLGVSVIRNECEYDSAWKHTTEANEPKQESGRAWNPRFICEELLEGPESSVEALVVNHSIVFLNITKKETNNAVELGHIVAQENSAVEQAMRVLVSQLEVDTGLLHAEFIGATPVECAGRPPGDRIAILIGKAWGFNLYEQWLKALCGMPVEVPPKPAASAAIRYLSAPPGRLTSFNDPSGRCVITTPIGAWVAPVSCSWDRVGYVEADTQAEAVRLAASVTFDTNNDIIVYLNHRRTEVEWAPAFAAATSAVLLTDKKFRPQGVVETIYLDTHDSERVDQAIADLNKTYNVQAVATFSDRDVETVARIANRYGLAALSPDAAVKARNKYEMRKAVREIAPTAVPNFSLLQPHDDVSSVLRANEIELPCVLKPVDASGSRGFSLCESHDDIAQALRRWNAPMIVENALKGTEHSAEGYVFAGRIHLIGVTDKTTTEQHRLEIAQVFPSAVPDIRELVMPLVEATVRATGIDYCGFHLEFFYDKNRQAVSLVEIAARPGGDFIASHLVPLVTGASFAGDLISIATGKSPSFALPRAGYYAATLKLHTDQQGIIRSLGSLPESPIVVDSIRHAQIGDRVCQPPEDTLGPILAEVIVVAGSRKEIADYQQRLESVEVQIVSE